MPKDPVERDPVDGRRVWAYGMSRPRYLAWARQQHRDALVQGLREYVADHAGPDVEQAVEPPAAERRSRKRRKPEPVEETAVDEVTAEGEESDDDDRTE